MQRAATVAALAALVLVAGGAAYLAAREDPTPPTTTAGPTTTTLGTDAVAGAIAAELQGDLTVAITDEEASCVAEGLVELVPPETLALLVDRPEPLTGVAPEVRDDLVRLVVGCLPEASAAALLGTATTTSALTGLPDEG